eukprot:7356454-Prymnesium_polylepis.1
MGGGSLALGLLGGHCRLEVRRCFPLTLGPQHCTHRLRIGFEVGIGLAAGGSGSFGDGGSVGDGQSGYGGDGSVGSVGGHKPLEATNRACRRLALGRARLQLIALRGGQPRDAGIDTGLDENDPLLRALVVLGGREALQPLVRLVEIR